MKPLLTAAAIVAVGYVAGCGVVLRWIADAIDAAVRIDGGLHR